MYMYNVLLFYTTYISADLAHHDTFRAKFDKGGINLCRKKSQFLCLVQFAYMPSRMAMASRRGCNGSPKQIAVRRYDKYSSFASLNQFSQMG